MLIKKKDIERLHEHRHESCASLYIPTHRAGFNNAKVDQLTFKNMLNEARVELEERGTAPDVSNRMLRPAYELLENEAFWTDLSDGLAVFISPDFFEYHILPESFESYYFVGDRFHVRPLLPMFTGGGKYFVLALSQNEVRFFEGQRHSITPVIIKDLLPVNIDEALFFSEAEETLQTHSSGSSIFHGQGKGKDDKIKDLKKYFRQVDDGLMEMLHDENAPLVLAAVEYLVPIYQEVSNYSNVMPFFIKGNPEDWSPMQLHERAWQLMGPHFKQEQEKAVEQFNASFPKGQASISAYDVVPSAIGGRVESLFMAREEANLWGQYNAQEHQIRFDLKRKPDSICLLNEAAVQTFLQGGTVYNIPFLELPYSFSSMNASYRY